MNPWEPHGPIWPYVGSHFWTIWPHVDHMCKFDGHTCAHMFPFIYFYGPIYAPCWVHTAEHVKDARKLAAVFSKPGDPISDFATLGGASGYPQPDPPTCVISGPVSKTIL